MWLATTGMFRAKWTARIHDEWISSLLGKRPDLSREALDQVRLLMDAAVPDCLVEGYEALIGSLDLPDPDDRHVLVRANLRAPPVSAEDLIARLEAREFIETAAFLRRALGSF